ncbi:MAG: polyamine aminopropyltransferase [Simkaniaceae bacterium]
MKLKYLSFTLLPLLVFAKQHYSENFYFNPSWHQTFKIKDILFEEKSDHQELIIFENEDFGRVLALDGIIQTTEGDEFIYHEMIVHVPMMTHENPKNVLIIGGGDGGSIREVLKHQSVEKVTLVEIDQAVVDLCKTYLPRHSNGAFDHEKAHIVIDDGAEFIRNTTEKFDVIICDSTDPVGPGAILFDTSFYQNCKKCLNKKGLFVSQNGVPLIQEDELVDAHQKLSTVFENVHHFIAPIPTYVGGFMVFSLSTDQNYKMKASRESEISSLKYYTKPIHKGAFALPPYILKHIK